MCAAILVGMIPFTIGLLHLFAPDFMWRLTEFNHELRGVRSERTAMWETLRPINGILFILFSFVVMFMVATTAMSKPQDVDKITPMDQFITPTATECTNVKEMRYIDGNGQIAVTHIELCP